MLVNLQTILFLLHFRSPIPPVKMIKKKKKTNKKGLYFMNALNIFSVLSTVRPAEVVTEFQKKEHEHLFGRLTFIHIGLHNG